MSLSHLKSQLKNDNLKVIFTDYYDTLVHRTVHPNSTLRIWSKIIIRELGLDITIDELYFIRQDSLTYLANKLGRDKLEIPYDSFKEEICHRLINNNVLDSHKKKSFIDLFEKADLRSETNVQYLNNNVLDLLRDFKKNGGDIYLVSDFYGSISLFKKLLKHHNIAELFNDVFSSASLEKCKHNGSIYKDVLSKLSLNANEVMMIGDNKVSDYINAKQNGLHSFLLPHQKHLRRNKRKGLGNDERQLKSVIKNLYKDCNKKKALPYTEYITFYHVFIEKLYKKCNKENIKDVFFLAREGQFLKKLFDSYQEYSSINNEYNVKSHYLKISRQASLQISLKNINDEDFGYLRNKYCDLSVKDFLTTLNCPDDILLKIASELKIDSDSTIVDFFNSETILKVKNSDTFIDFYENHRLESRNAFNNYMESFGVDINKNGVTIVDIGWGGTMQESIFNFFDKKAPVTGYYLGLKEIYDIQEQTKRFGLLFSILPYTTYHDHILMANTQFYEQFSAANHGSSIGYTNKNDGDYSLEYYEPNEKWLFDNYIKDHQIEMFKHHQLLLEKLENICYEDSSMHSVISNLALKVGLFQHSRKLEFVKSLNTGFYQNIGTNQVGLEYKIPTQTNLIKDAMGFLITPEKYFRYLVKINLLIYKKSKILAFLFPASLIYIYFNFNKFIRYKGLNKILLLKYNLLK